MKRNDQPFGVAVVDVVVVVDLLGVLTAAPFAVFMSVSLPLSSPPTPPCHTTMHTRTQPTTRSAGMCAKKIHIRNEQDKKGNFVRDFSNFVLKR
jgi:hypothetical protein